MKKLAQNRSFFLTLLALTFFSFCNYTHGKSVRKNHIFKGHYKIGIASWYGKRFNGRKTASGKLFNMYDYTAAHRSLPLGTKIKVTNLKNGREVIVDIIDRGPYIKGHIIDLSYAAARAIGIIKSGTEIVKIEIISDQASKVNKDTSFLHPYPIKG
jgi:rare lipoprotein A